MGCRRSILRSLLEPTWRKQERQPWIQQLFLRFWLGGGSTTSSCILWNKSWSYQDQMKFLDIGRHRQHRWPFRLVHLLVLVLIIHLHQRHYHIRYRPHPPSWQLILTWFIRWRHHRSFTFCKNQKWFRLHWRCLGKFSSGFFNKIIINELNFSYLKHIQLNINSFNTIFQFKIIFNHLMLRTYYHSLENYHNWKIEKIYQISPHWFFD